MRDCESGGEVLATGVKVTVVNAAAGFPASFFGLAFLVAVRGLLFKAALVKAALVSGQQG